MGWVSRPFGELFAEPTRNGLTRPKAVRGHGVKMVNMGELFAHPRLRNAPMDRVPLSQSESERFLLKDGDLLFARQSLVLEGAGKCSIFLRDDEAVTFESHVTRVRLDPTKADPSFYFYYLQSHHGRAAIRGIVEQGAGASGIRGSDLLSLDVLWCPLPEQRAIAGILDSLDDKIELNRQMAATLEEMARAIFKSWFIDFDPVRAKAEGRPTNLPPEVDALFPGSLSDSGLGAIPDGWRIGSIAELADIGGGSTPSTKSPEFWDGDHAWATPKDLSKLSHPVLLQTERRITDAGLRSISSGLYPAGTVLMSSRAPIGYLAISEIPLAVNQGFIALRPKIENGSVFLLNWLQSHMDEVHRRANGSTFMEISKSSFRSIETFLPPEALIAAFGVLIDPLHERLVATTKESHELADIRDALLPKLISGEMEVPRSP